MKLAEIKVAVKDRQGTDHEFRFRPMTVRERFSLKPRLAQGAGDSDYGVVVDFFGACFLGCNTLPDVQARERGGLDEAGLERLVAVFGEWPLISATWQAVNANDLDGAEKKA